MNEQLDLHGGFALTPAGTTLTVRQRAALEFVASHQPVASDELGAFLHADRLARGRRGHNQDSRCDFCAREGNQIGRALRDHRDGPFLVRKRGLGWCLPDWRAVPAEPSSQNADWPEGF